MSLSLLRRFTQVPVLPRSAIAIASRNITTTNPKPLSQPAFAPSPVEDMPAPVRTTAQWAEFGREHVTNGLGRLKDHVMVKGEGLNLYTSEGEKYLDFTAGIGVTNLGQ
jgi:4-aminobutyrate aminotransferase